MYVCTVSQPSKRVQILALDDIRNEMIGDEEVRGISGGQRKRVNVGLELVADPIMLFLDEPTSGLDSTSSKMVISALQEVSTYLQTQPPPNPNVQACLKTSSCFNSFYTNFVLNLDAITDCVRAATLPLWDKHTCPD